MLEHKRKPLRVVSVHVDIVEFLWETEKVLRKPDPEVVQWLEDLRKCLATRDPTISEYGAKLLSEVEAFREFDRNRKRKAPAPENQAPPVSGESRESVESKDEKPKAEDPPPPPPPAPDPLLDPLSIESRFEEARKQFPGRKLGFAVEFQNFVKKVGGRSKAAAEVDRLLPGIEAEKADREKKTAARAFVPEWKNFKTWINAKAWEQEFAAAGSSPAPKAASNRQADREAKLRSGFALAAKLKESAGISAPALPLEVEK